MHACTYTHTCIHSGNFTRTYIYTHTPHTTHTHTQYMHVLHTYKCSCLHVYTKSSRPWSELSMSVLEKQELSEVPQNFECQENGTYLVTTECADVTCKFEFVFYVVNGKKKRRFLKKQRQQSQERQRQQVLEELQGQVLEWQRQQFLERQRQQVLEEQEVKNLEEQGQEENITP